MVGGTMRGPGFESRNVVPPRSETCFFNLSKSLSSYYSEVYNKEGLCKQIRDYARNGIAHTYLMKPGIEFNLEKPHLLKDKKTGVININLCQFKEHFLACYIEVKKDLELFNKTGENSKKLDFDKGLKKFNKSYFSKSITVPARNSQ